jgi:DNA-binding MarR family transcriptional regulator
MAKENTVKKRDTGHAANASSVQSSRSLDNLIHERTRLAIVSALAVNASLTFGELKDSLNLSDGNLSVHSQKLEDAGYVNCKKTFAGRKPRSEFRLTAKGRAALNKYLNHMEKLIQVVRKD